MKQYGWRIKTSLFSLNLPPVWALSVLSKQFKQRAVLRSGKWKPQQIANALPVLPSFHKWHLIALIQKTQLFLLERCKTFKILEDFLILYPCIKTIQSFASFVALSLPASQFLCLFPFILTAMCHKVPKISLDPTVNLQIWPNQRLLLQCKKIADLLIIASKIVRL